MEVNKNNLVDFVIRYESGELEDSEIISLFQYLVSSGLAWTLQGSYGRFATQLIAQGVITSAIPDLQASLKPLGFTFQ